MKGVLLVNLGSPDSPSVPDVRRYLREFLMDKRVIDVNWFLRFAIVHFVILPFRPKQSAHAYASVWTAAGSPLVVTSRNVRQALEARAQVPVGLAMRYQNPSIPHALRELSGRGVRELLVIPLFPHYAMSSYETAAERVREVAARHFPGLRIAVQPPYYADPDYIRALVSTAAAELEGGFDRLLFSFHGVPERQIRKSDPTGRHCLATPDCCQRDSAAHATCYRAQCFATVQAFVQAAGIPHGRYAVAFQSRLGRDPWLTPFTDREIERLAREGVRKLVVMCPAFVSDCLETIEEIGMRGREVFLENGGKEYVLVPCLNEHPAWIDTLDKMTARFLAPERSA